MLTLSPLVEAAKDIIPLPRLHIHFSPIEWKKNQVSRIRREIMRSLKGELGGSIYDVQIIDGDCERQFCWALLGSGNEEGAKAALTNRFFNVSKELYESNPVMQDWETISRSWTQNRKAASICHEELVHSQGQGTSQDQIDTPQRPVLVHADGSFESRLENEIVYMLDEALRAMDVGRKKSIYGRALGAMALWGVLARSLEYAVRDNDFSFIEKRAGEIVDLAARFMKIGHRDRENLIKAVTSAVEAVASGCDDVAVKHFIGLLCSPLWSCTSEGLSKRVLSSHTHWNEDMGTFWSKLVYRASNAMKLASREWERIKKNWPEVYGKQRADCSLCTKAGDNWAQRAQQNRGCEQSLGCALMEIISRPLQRHQPRVINHSVRDAIRGVRGKHKLSELWLTSARDLCSMFTMLVNFIHMSHRGESATSPSLGQALNFAQAIGMNINEDSDGMIAMVIRKIYEQGGPGANRIENRTSLPKSPTLTISGGDVCFFFPESHIAYVMARKVHSSNSRCTLAAQSARRSSLTFLRENGPNKVGLVCLSHIIGSLKPSLKEDKWYESKTRMNLILGLANEGGEQLLTFLQDDRKEPLPEEYSIAQVSWGSLLKMIERATSSISASERAWVCRAVITHLCGRGMKPQMSHGPTGYWDLAIGFHNYNERTDARLRVDWPVPLMGSIWERVGDGVWRSNMAMIQAKDIERWTPTTNLTRKSRPTVTIRRYKKTARQSGTSAGSQNGAITTVECGNEWGG